MAIGYPHTRQVVTQHRKGENQPVKRPLNGGEEDGCLERAGVPREHGGKSQIERCALRFYASNVRPYCPYKDRNPKQREESLIRLIA
jgi:hypothetical protein